YSPGEALRHMERALEFWQSVPDAEVLCGMDIAEALRLAAMSAQAAGEPERALALYDEALTELGATDDIERAASVLAAKASVVNHLGRAEASVELWEQVVAMLPAEPPTVVRASALVELLFQRWNVSGDVTDLPAAATQALDAARRAGAREEEALA